jgi:hypothetical protein
MYLSTTDTSVSPSVDQITVGMTLNGYFTQIVVEGDQLQVSESGTHTVNITNGSDVDNIYKISVGQEVVSTSTASSGATTLAELTDSTTETTDPLITSNLAVGHFWINSTSGEAFVCTDATTNDNVWTNIGEGVDHIPFPFFGTGGVENTYILNGVNYKSHTFLTSGLFVAQGGVLGSVDILVVAGGGGGGSNLANASWTGWGGGGGAGGFRALTAQSVSQGTYTVTVGPGGVTASNGDDSSFDQIVATGGGSGAVNNQLSGSGGSGGGGCGWPPAYAVGATGNAGGYDPVEGYAGGDGHTASPEGGAGGGGAGGVGHAGITTGTAAGGVGAINNYRVGVDVFYGGGGGGSLGRPDLGQGDYTTAVGGAGGGGAGGRSDAIGSQTPIAGVAGDVNTGGGGGGGVHGANGGSGIVIVRYAI